MSTIITKSGHCFVTDYQVLWLKTTKVGTPDAWEPGKNYKIGDTVVPTVIEAGQEDIMFQCVGFLGQTDSSEPTFDILPGATTQDGNVEWTAREKDKPIPGLEFNEYYLIDEDVTVE